MKIKLFIDEDVHASLAHALNQRGFDALHAQAMGRAGLPDDEQLAYSVRHRRCIFSFNVRDFVLLHNSYVANGRNHYGIVVSKQLPLGITLNRLLKLLSQHSQDSMRNNIEFL